MNNNDSKNNSKDFKKKSKSERKLIKKNISFYSLLYNKESQKRKKLHDKIPINNNLNCQLKIEDNKKEDINEIKEKNKSKLYKNTNLIDKNMYNNFEIKIYKKNNANPINIKFLKDLSVEAYSFCYLDNIFIVFHSFNNNILYLIYTNKKKSIISYNLINNKRINEVKNAHRTYITNFRYCLDKNNKRDLIISISCNDNNIKLWNINNLECLHNFENIYNSGQLFSACFLNNNNQINIITGNSNFNNSELIKIYDINGNKIKEINNSNDNIFFIDVFYDNKFSKIYIITGNFGNAKSYDYNENKIYHKYNINDNRSHNNIIINDKEEIIKLLECSYDGDIKIWNFHSGELLNKLIIIYNNLYGICLWDNEYLFIGCEDGSIKLLNIKKGKIIKNLIGHKKRVLNIKKINHPLYEECLVSQDNDYQMKLWANLDKNKI